MIETKGILTKVRDKAVLEPRLKASSSILLTKQNQETIRAAEDCFEAASIFLGKGSRQHHNIKACNTGSAKINAVFETIFQNRTSLDSELDILMQ